MKKPPTRRMIKKRRSVTRDKRNLRLNPKWSGYLNEEAAPATIDYWLDLTNHPPTLGANFNFQIRNFRQVPAEEAKSLLDHVRKVIASVALLPEWAGYDTFDHSPAQLFHDVLQTVPPGRIRECVACKTFFEVKRKDQTACSRPCANLARQKRFRDRWRDYERNRKRNQVEKAKLAAMKAERRSRELKTRRS